MKITLACYNNFHELLIGNVKKLRYASKVHAFKIRYILSEHPLTTLVKKTLPECFLATKNQKKIIKMKRHKKTYGAGDRTKIKQLVKENYLKIKKKKIENSS